MKYVHIFFPFVILTAVHIFASDPDPIELLKEAYRIAETLDPEDEKNAKWTEPFLEQNRHQTSYHTNRNGDTGRNSVLIHVATGLAKHGYLGTAREVISKMDASPGQIEEAYLLIAAHLLERGEIEKAEDILYDNCTDSLKINSVLVQGAMKQLEKGEIALALKLFPGGEANYFRDDDRLDFFKGLMRIGEYETVLYELLAYNHYTHRMELLVLLAKESEKNARLEFFEEVLEVAIESLNIKQFREYQAAVILLDYLQKSGREENARKLYEQIEENIGRLAVYALSEYLLMAAICGDGDEIAERLEEFVDNDYVKKRWNMFPIAYIRMKRYEKAREYLERITKDDPDYKDVSEGTWYYETSLNRMIDMLIETEEYEEAIAFARDYLPPVKKAVYFGTIMVLQEKSGKSEGAKKSRQLLEEIFESKSFDDWNVNNIRNRIIRFAGENDMPDIIREQISLLGGTEFKTRAWMWLAKAENARGNSEAVSESVKLLESIKNLSQQTEAAGELAGVLREMNELETAKQVLRIALPKPDNTEGDFRVPVWTVLRQIELGAYEDAYKTASMIKDPLMKARCIAEIGKR